MRIYIAIITFLIPAFLNASPIHHPKVTHFEWGKIVVDSTTYKDCRLWPNHHEAWNWDKTNTRHVPGIQIADLSDFVNEIDIIILSQGVDGILKIKPETIEYLKKQNKEIHIARTPQAIELYNKLSTENKRVGALLHSTC